MAVVLKGMANADVVKRCVLSVEPYNLSQSSSLLSVEEIATKKGISMAQVAIAWSLAFPGVTAPIIGTTKLENLKEAIGTSTFSFWISPELRLNDVTQMLLTSN